MPIPIWKIGISVLATPIVLGRSCGSPTSHPPTCIVLTQAVVIGGLGDVLGRMRDPVLCQKWIFSNRHDIERFPAISTSPGTVGNPDSGPPYGANDPYGHADSRSH
jgi:hypothetical protein